MHAWHNVETMHPRTWLSHKKGMRHIGLLSPAESAVVKRSNGMTAAAAYKFIATLEIENSAMGIAGWQPP